MRICEGWDKGYHRDVNRVVRRSSPRVDAGRRKRCDVFSDSRALSEQPLKKLLHIHSSSFRCCLVGVALASCCSKLLPDFCAQYSEFILYSSGPVFYAQQIGYIGMTEEQHRLMLHCNVLV